MSLGTCKTHVRGRNGCSSHNRGQVSENGVAACLCWRGTRHVNHHGSTQTAANHTCEHNARLKMTVARLMASLRNTAITFAPGARPSCTRVRPRTHTHQAVCRHVPSASGSAGSVLCSCSSLFPVAVLAAVGLPRAQELGDAGFVDPCGGGGIEDPDFPCLAPLLREGMAPDKPNEPADPHTHTGFH